MNQLKAHYHLPGLFEFYEFYKAFLPVFREHREFFYDYCDIASIYGAPADALWGGGRVGFGDAKAQDVLSLTKEYNISARLTFSNSLIREEHLSDPACNRLCKLFHDSSNGIIVHSDLLLDYIHKNYPEFYFVSSTTKVITDFKEFERELSRDLFSYVVPDFRLNKDFNCLESLPQYLKDKVEFLCNECCLFDCSARHECYKNVSHKALGDDVEDHICINPDKSTYSFVKAMKNPGFIGIEDIVNSYLPMGFTNYKIEGRSLGSAFLLEFILHYMTIPKHQLDVREMLYLDSSLDLF